MLLFFFPLQNAADPTAADLPALAGVQNNDGELNFLEFWQLIGHLARKHARVQPIGSPEILCCRSVCVTDHSVSHKGWKSKENSQMGNTLKSDLTSGCCVLFLSACTSSRLILSPPTANKCCPNSFTRLRTSLNCF